MTYTAITSPSSGDIYAKTRWDNQVKGNIEHIRDNVPFIHLPLISALAPLSGITPASLVQAESSAGNPKPNWLYAGFDADADEGLQWNVVLPRDYGTSPVLRVYYYMASATADEVIWVCQIAALTDDDSISAKAFDAVNTFTDTVPGTAGKITYADITLTNADSMAASDFVMVYLYRDADAGADNATGDARFLYANLLYTLA